MNHFYFSAVRYGLSFLSFLLIGCGSSVPSAQIKTLSQAQQKFLDVCKGEHKLTVHTKLFPHTFWIYVPVEHRLIDYKSTKDGPQKSNERSEKFALNYLDGNFKDGAFEFEYDISKAVSYSVSYGYSSLYTEEYQQTQQKILTTFYHSYAELYGSSKREEKSFAERTESFEDFIKSFGTESRPPEFVVLIIADVKKGIEITSLFTFQDFFKAMVDPYTMPQEEFSRRNVTDIAGHDAILEDFEGKHVEAKDITWPEFLTKQIINRIRFKYQYSDFKPEEDPEQEVLRITARATDDYQFHDFSAVKLYNLATKTPYRFTPDQLKSFMDE